MSEPQELPSDFAETTPDGHSSLASIVFVDVCGSTGMFETLGNERATLVITRITDWLGQCCLEHGGTLIKTLGDGALMRFNLASDAITMCLEVQRRHEKRISLWPEQIRTRLQIGLASGEVVDKQGDCFGDAVNVAARLAGMSGAGQIWADALTMDLLPTGHDVHVRSLGAVPVRGKVESLQLYAVEWSDVAQTGPLTVPAGLPMPAPVPQNSDLTGIDLNWLDLSAHFRAEDGVIIIGRSEDAQFVVQDSRVSRQHARIDWQSTPSGGHFVLTDLSSYGSWVRFANSSQEVELRRQSCTLTADGEIALGAPFSDFSVPTVSFALGEARLSVVRHWR